MRRSSDPGRTPTIAFLHLFTEREIDPLPELESEEGVRSDPDAEVDRLFLDIAASDALSTRFGKFLKPVGRRNIVQAEPSTWTTSEPLIVEEVFDESSTGAMRFGSVFGQGSREDGSPA